MDNKKSGVIYALSAYLIWGLLAAYWKLFSGVPAIDVLAQRMFWAFMVSLAVLIARGAAGEIVSLFKDRKRRRLVILRAALITINWYTYIWGVSNGYVLETSLGYYLNPLVSIFLGLIFLKERLNGMQWTAVALAASGVALKTVLAGSFPFVAVVLAFSFGFYGLLKKISTDSAMTGIASESLVILPIVLVYIINSEVSGPAVFTGSGALMKILFISTGAVTVTPLFLFSKAAGRIPLVWVGFLQFLAPTLMMIFGIFLFHEEMTVFDLTGFAAVWAGIILFVISNLRRARKKAEAAEAV